MSRKRTLHIITRAYIILAGDQGLGREEAESAGGDQQSAATEGRVGIAAGRSSCGLPAAILVPAGCEARDKARSSGRRSIRRAYEGRRRNGGRCETEQTQFTAGRVRQQQQTEFLVAVCGA